MTNSLLVRVFNDNSDLILFAIQVANDGVTGVAASQVDAARAAAKKALEGDGACVYAVTNVIHTKELQGVIEITVKSIN